MSTEKNGLGINKRDLQSPAGFEDWHPAEAIVLDRVLGVIRKHYECAGFSPLYTHFVERPKILTAKASGEVRGQIYKLELLASATKTHFGDQTEIALRFDHTVPLARYVAENHGALLFPFRRYTIGQVFRGEQPKDGRYREFIQADIDVIGDGKLAPEHDAEMVSIIHAVFNELNFGPFTIRINNRKIVAGFLRSVGCDTEEKVKIAGKAIDDFEKNGGDKTIITLIEAGITEDDAQRLLDLLTKSYTMEEAFTLLRSQDFGPEFEKGVRELEAVMENVRAFGVPEARFCVDLSLVRGFDYYTGTVYEARLDEYPQLGSVAGGGRFDNLADHFSSKHLPGVGISIGVTRLVRRLMDDGIVKTGRRSVASVLLASRNVSDEKAVHLNRARILRDAGIPTELYLDERKLGGQIESAVKRGIKLVVFTKDGGDGRVVIRDVRERRERDQVEVHESELLETVRSML